MKVHFRADSADGTHTKFTVFMNGANCGQLCMREYEAIFFHDRIIHSTYAVPNDIIWTSGRWTKEDE